MKMKTAAVIIPCLNEENTVGKVIDDLKTVSKKTKIKFHIIAIDDASTDNTLKILKNKAEKVVELKTRKSLSEVIKVGLKESLKYNPDIVIHIDADNQYNALELPKLISAVEKNQADLVLGNRDVWHLNHMPLLKKIGNIFFSLLVTLIVRQKIQDAQTGFRVINYEVASKIKLKSNYTYTQEEIIKAKQLGYRIKEINIKFRRRSYGRSKVVRTPLQYGVHVLKDIIKIVFKFN